MKSLDAVLQIIEKVRKIPDMLRVIQKEHVVLDCLVRCRPRRYSENQEALQEIWDVWMDCNKLTPSWENLRLYRQCFGAAEPFVSFLERHMETLRAQPFPPDWEPSLTEGILTSDLEAPCFDANIRMGLAVYQDRVMEQPRGYTAEMADLEAIAESGKLDDSGKVFFIETYASGEYSKTLASFLCTSRVPLSKNVFRRAWDALGEEDRYALFLNQIWIFTLDEIAEYLQQLGPEYQTWSRRHEGKLCDTEYNRKLAENLEKIRYLSSCQIEDFGDTDAQNEESRRLVYTLS